MSKVLLAICLLFTGIFNVAAFADDDSYYDVSKYMIGGPAVDGSASGNKGYITEIDKPKFKNSDSEDNNYDVAKALLSGAFDNAGKKMIEAKPIIDDTRKFVQATKVSPSDFDAAKYLIEDERKNPDKYYVKPTEVSANDFDAAKYLLGIK